MADRRVLNSRGDLVAPGAINAATGIAESAGPGIPFPSGAIMFFDLVEPPDGWLVADGSEISRTEYPTLFANIGTRHGAGDGSTTFNLPDLRGEFLRGHDQGRGLDNGRAFGSVQEGTMINSKIDANHNIPMGYGDGNIGTPFSLGYAANAAVSGTLTNQLYQRVRPRNVAILACIKI